MSSLKAREPCASPSATRPFTFQSVLLRGGMLSNLVAMKDLLAIGKSDSLSMLELLVKLHMLAVRCSRTAANKTAFASLSSPLVHDSAPSTTPSRQQHLRSWSRKASRAFRAPTSKTQTQLLSTTTRWPQNIGADAS